MGAIELRARRVHRLWRASQQGRGHPQRHRRENFPAGRTGAANQYQETIQIFVRGRDDRAQRAGHTFKHIPRNFHSRRRCLSGHQGFRGKNFLCRPDNGRSDC